MATSQGRKWQDVEYSPNACFINVSLMGHNHNEPVGDSIYLSHKVWNVIENNVNNFNPDVMLISGGFDAAYGDDEGFAMTPHGYYEMTGRCMSIMRNKPVVMVLEGGYKPDIIASCICAVVTALLRKPFE